MRNNRTIHRTIHRPTAYVPGTYKRIPASMVSYRDQFKQVGKQVFVIVAAPNVALDKDVRTLSEIALKNPTMTVKQLAALTVKTLRKATPAEQARYDASVARLKAFTAKVLDAERNRKIKAAQATLLRCAKLRIATEKRLAKLGAAPLYS